MGQIEILGGEQTEKLLIRILDGIENESPNTEIEIRRTLQPGIGLGGEPLTMGAVILIAGSAIPLVARIIERWIESSRQKTHLELVVKGFEHSSEAGQALTRLAENHKDVAVSYTLAKQTTPKTH